jgi:hypothetical protein
MGDDQPASSFPAVGRGNADKSSNAKTVASISFIARPF